VSDPAPDPVLLDAERRRAAFIEALARMVEAQV